MAAELCKLCEQICSQCRHNYEGVISSNKTKSLATLTRLLNGGEIKRHRGRLFKAIIVRAVWARDKEKIQAMYLACYTQEEIADSYNTPRKTINDETLTFGEFGDVAESAKSVAFFQETETNKKETGGKTRLSKGKQEALTFLVSAILLAHSHRLAPH